MHHSDYLCGGYYLVKRFSRPTDVDPDLPSTLVSLSNCFTDIGPGAWALRSWGWTLEDITEDAGALGIPKELVTPMLDWCTPDKLNDHPNSFRTSGSALDFRGRFVRSNDIVVLGVGLHRERMGSFRAQLDKDPNRGYGLLEQLERQEPLLIEGSALGFEPLGFGATMFHSWLCHNSPPEVRKEMGIITNENGMISDLVDAIRVTEHLIASGAESAAWEPWLIMQY